MPSISLIALLKELSPHESLLDSLSLLDVIKFYQVCCHIKPEICLFAARPTDPPCALPTHICILLMMYLGIPDVHVEALWSSLKETIWNDADSITFPLSKTEMDKLDLYGKMIDTPSRRIASRMFYPPVSACTQCAKPFRYSTISRYRVTHFSLRHGSRDAYTTSFSCSKCAIRFYPNYYIEKKTRFYYTSSVPSVIQIEDHAFVSAELCELFTHCMLFAWVSSQNCSNIFNHSLSQRTDLEHDSTLSLSSEQASRAFLYNALLRESSERCQPLVMSESGDNDARLKDALERRNREYIYNENHHKARGKGLFQCAQRLKRIGHSTAYLDDSIGKSVVSTEEIADISEDEEDDPTHKSDAGNREPKARFGRRRTHNEQLVVACCGVVTGRVTMYGAEAISGVKDVLKSIYQTREDLPTVIFYDNNCHLQAHLLKQGDTYFQNTILPVDVFHFKSKHKKTDEFCQRHCNPAQWKELVDVKTNKWRFNSSIAEQVNVWMGGYMAVVREMLPYHFDFFLDEMIKRRNQIIIHKLKTQGSIPYRIPPHCREG
ncbi:hypothetical protein ONZ45_g14924 [Pleurotus djamor]|nr:hypothetical protein ONZ45_g14924 [Pleurotus djamor]